MNGIWTERYLAIEEGYLANLVSQVNQGLNFTLPAMQQPQVDLVSAENSYSKEDLYWMGIKTEASKSGLIAIIPVRGPLSRGWGYGTSMDWVARASKIANENVYVRAIVFDFDTPGGTVAGSITFADAIKNVTKPTVGFASSMVASCGYLGYSQCNECWIESDKTTQVGGIGVYGTYMSYAEQLAKAGIDVRVLRSKGSEDKALLNPVEKLNEDALKDEQELIDLMRVEMLGKILYSRPQIDPNISGKVYFGQNAIKVGLADNVGKMGDVIRRADYLGRKQ